MPLDLDVTDPDACERGVAEVIGRFGSLDVLVNNAGIGGNAHSVDGYSVDMWRRVMAINLDGVFHCCRAVLPHMLERGTGWIVNVASIAGKEGNPNMCAYSASKAGVIGFTKSLGKEVAQKGVIVNCITPAVIETEILMQLNQQAVDYMVSRIPMGRTGKPEEVAAMVSWLSSPECSFTTGGVFDISGGRATY
jgi:3-oxoacyl-[acyl-carrier protein] reductase